MYLVGTSFNAQGQSEYRRLRTCFNRTNVSEQNACFFEFLAGVRVNEVRNIPLTYYYFQFRVANNTSDTSAILLYLAMCNYVLRQPHPLATEKDWRILGKLHVNVPRADSIEFWKNLVTQKIDSFGRIIEFCRREIRWREDSIKCLEESKKRIENMKSTDSLTLENLKGNAKRVEEQINKFINEGFDGQGYEGNSNLKVNKNVTSPVIIIPNSEEPLGQYCDDSVIESVRIVANSVFMKMRDLNRLGSATIELEITGKADGWGYGQIVRKYTESAPIPVKYWKNDTLVEKTIRRNEGITNSELAFLRAYCVYNEFLRFFNENGCKNRIESSTFYVSEHRERGGEYRGFSLKMKIKNLFQHNKKKIEELERKIKDYDDEIRELEHKKNKYRAVRDKYHGWIRNIDESDTLSNISIEIRNKHLERR